MSRPSHTSSLAFSEDAQYHLTKPEEFQQKPNIHITGQKKMTSSDSKSYNTFETASISTDSLMSEKDHLLKKAKKPSLVKRAVEGA
jgi:hypothetical protein